MFHAVYVGINGAVVALDPISGSELWTAHLTGPDFVNVAFDGEKIYATSQGEIFCLHPATGAVLWHNPLKGHGRGLATISAARIATQSSTTAAEQRQRNDAASGTIGAAPA